MADWKRRLRKYQQALDLDGHFALGYAELAIAYLRQFYVTREPANLDSDALTDYGNAARLNPRNHLTQRNMGDCYTVLGNWVMARQRYGGRAVAVRVAGNESAGRIWMGQPVLL